jgi:hypothetical protein
MAAASNQPPEFPLRSRNIAMLVIHGIGEQNPYETLDSFARGVFQFLLQKPGIHDVDLSSVRVALKDWTQVGMRITVNPGEGADLEGLVDIFEYYWAPQTEDKLNWKDTLNWLIRTDLTPLRYFADNLQEMMDARGASFGSAFWYSIKLYAREILRVLLLYLPLAVGLLWLLAWLSHPRTIWDSVKPIGAALRPYSAWPKPLVLACYASALLMTWFMIQSLGAYLRRGRKTMQGWAEGVWFGLALLSAAFFFMLGSYLASRFAVDMSPLLAVIFSKGVLLSLLAVSLAALWRYILTGYVADIAVYESSDAKSKNFVARNAILQGSSAALARILTNDRYDRVILAGHSLGSVIAYDTINDLLAQFNGASGPVSDRLVLPLTLAQLQKLRGLVTFGSPLDKIYYFFREQVKENQAIRAQILSMLHSFRRLPSGRDYAPYEFTYAFRQLDGLVWVNAYAPMDPVSGRFKFYALRDEDQRSFRYWIPGLAHLSYWEDPNFYAYFGQKLL